MRFKLRLHLLVDPEVPRFEKREENNFQRKNDRVESRDRTEDLLGRLGGAQLRQEVHHLDAEGRTRVWTKNGDLQIRETAVLSHLLRPRLG